MAPFPEPFTHGSIIGGKIFLVGLVNLNSCELLLPK